MANDFSGDSNCKALWRFENGALTADSKSSNTLTDNNTVGTDTTTYKEGSASADFETSNGESLTITDASLASGFPLKSGDVNKKISVAFWWKPEAVEAAQYLVCKGTSTGNTRSFSVYFSAPDAYKLSFLFGYGSGASWEKILFSTGVVADRWYHIGATYDDSDKSYLMRVWDDTAGALLAADLTGTATNNINIENGPLGIGGQSGNIYTVDGLLDEVVIFDDILTTDEIDAIRAGTYGAGSTLLPIFFNHYNKLAGA